MPAQSGQDGVPMGRSDVRADDHRVLGPPSV